MALPQPEPTMQRSTPALALLVLVGVTAAARAQEGTTPRIFTFQGGTPRISLGEGQFRTTIQPLLRVDLDAGSFWGQELVAGGPPRLDATANVRRARIGLGGTIFRDFSYTFLWEFGTSPRGQSDGGTIYELQAAYTGLENVAIRVGGFTPMHTIDYSMSSFELLMLERPAISNLVASLASGDSRLAAGVEAHGSRWFAAGYVSDGVISTLHDDRQRGIAGRGAWLVADEPSWQLQLGINGSAQFRPGPNNDESIRLRDYPELRLDETRLLDTRAIQADQGWSLGPEISGRIGPVYLQGEYYHIGVDPKAGSSRSFDGWYVAAAMPLIGEPRTRSASRAAWGRPRFEELDPNTGSWGWLELAGRYSYVNLNDGPARGGRQSIWSVALNWYPARRLRFSTQYMVGKVALDGPDRDFQAVGVRLAFNL